VLTCHAAQAVGIDIVEDLVRTSRVRYPRCRFEWLDCFEEPERLQALLAELRPQGSRMTLFVDVGGHATTAMVCRILAAVAGAAAKVGATPSLVVIKSRNHATEAAKCCDGEGIVRDAHAFWRKVAEQPQTRSALQFRRKQARARAAMWANNPISQAFF
ncbi:unnamed protein product, partial [Polarella glacialis]